MCAIPHLDPVKWQQFVTFHEALTTVRHVADAVQTSKQTITLSALVAHVICCTLQFKQKLQKGLPFRDPFSQKVILTLVCDI
jgi:hypothetical protein